MKILFVKLIILSNIFRGSNTRKLHVSRNLKDGRRQAM